jgi:hypothetical protein
MNAIFVPSGDHRGKAACWGGYVSWSLPVPSTRLTDSLDVRRIERVGDLDS